MYTLNLPTWYQPLDARSMLYLYTLCFTTLISIQKNRSFSVFNADNLLRKVESY